MSKKDIQQHPMKMLAFVRVKDITLSYDFPKDVLGALRLSKLQLYASGKNLITITDFGGLDPELNNQWDIPLQKEFSLGLNLEF